VLASIGDGVILLDRKGVVRLWNPAAEAITGLAAADVTGRRAAEAIGGWAEIADRVPVATAVPAGGGRAETLPLSIEGRELWLSVSGIEFDDGTVYAFRDLTDERAVEEMKTDFVATVSHEVRTPLAAIYGAAMTLRRSDKKIPPESQERLLTVIADEADRLARIVNEILLASHLDSGELALASEDFDPAELAAGVVEAARVRLPQNVTLDLVARGDLPRVATDGDKVRQVLVNLVENAIKYSPDGGRVELAIDQADGQLRFSIHDEGLGVPPQEHRRIFGKFYRLDPDLTRGVGGTGLGLYICQELVRLLRGRIWVESRPGKGSTFAFELPLAAPEGVKSGPRRRALVGD
jgi:two-component system phosphate regulon sensor histidine kinase PhoR